MAEEPRIFRGPPRADDLCPVRFENVWAETYGTGELVQVSYSCLHPTPCGIHDAPDSPEFLG